MNSGAKLARIALLLVPGIVASWMPLASGEPVSGTDPGKSPPGAPAASSAAPAGLSFSLEVGNRMYPTWREEVRVALGQPFYLGDTEYSATANRFLPDFRIGEDGPFSLSEELGNPALELIIHRDTTAVDSSWAFQNFPPHFSPRSFFTFRIVDIASDGAGAQESTTE